MAYVCSGRETKLEEGDVIIFDLYGKSAIAFFRPAVNSFIDVVGNFGLIPISLVKFMAYKFVEDRLKGVDEYRIRFKAFSALRIC